MNMKTIQEYCKAVPSIEVSERKGMVETLTDAMMTSGMLVFDNAKPYMRCNDYYHSINEEEAYAVIFTMLSPSSRLIVSSSAIKECYKRLVFLPELQRDMEEKFFENQYLLHVTNGVFDIMQQELLQHDIRYCFNYMLNFNYIPDRQLSDAPVFKRYVETSIGMENLNCLLRTTAYCCSSLTKGRKAALMIGLGKTGKSTWLNLMETVVGKDLASHEPFHTMSNQQSKAKYVGKRINISRDNSNKPMKFEDSFKSLISCEETTGRNLYENSKDFLPTLKFIFASNCDLNFAHPDDAVYDRLVILPFTRAIPDEQKDPELEEKLIAEKDVIFSMAVDTLKAFVESRYDFCMSQEAEEMIAHKRMELHSVEEFLQESCVLDTNGSISSLVLSHTYESWCRENDMPPIGRNGFYKGIKNFSKKIQYKKVLYNGKYVNGFCGIRFKGTTVQETEPEIPVMTEKISKDMHSKIRECQDVTEETDNG